MTINKKTGAVILILLVITAVRTLYNTDTNNYEHTDISELSVIKQTIEVMPVTKIQGEDLRKADLWLAEQNRMGLQLNSAP